MSIVRSGVANGWISRLRTGRRPTSTSSVATAPAIASDQTPAPAAMPSAALVQSAAAVVTPRTDPRSRMIAPAPMKPIPDATCAATRIGSTFGPRAKSGKPCAPAQARDPVAPGQGEARGAGRHERMCPDPGELIARLALDPYQGAAAAG